MEGGVREEDVALVVDQAFGAVIDESRRNMPDARSWESTQLQPSWPGLWDTTLTTSTPLDAHLPFVSVFRFCYHTHLLLLHSSD